MDIKKTEDECKAFVELIQRQPRPLTDRSIAFVKQLSIEMGSTPEQIKQENALMERVKSDQERS